jgi:glycerol uptake facilitator-like aquaporin
METGKASFELGKRRGFYQALFYEFLGAAVVTWAYNIANKDPQIRAAAFFIIYLLAVNVSGGHFNPAVSVAVYLTEKENRNLRYLICAIVVQVLGCGFGVLIAYFLLKDYQSG